MFGFLLREFVIPYLGVEGWLVS